MMNIKNYTVKLTLTNKLKPYKNNPRQNKNAVEAVAESLKEFGFKQPIVVDKKMVIVVGHTRFEAAKLLGMKKVPVLVASDLTTKQIKAYRIADNKTAEFSDWDYDLLNIELGDLKDIFTGFDSLELEELLGFENQNNKDPDDIPALNKKSKSKRGDVYQLGKHRLMVGDSTDPADVKKLMKGHTAELLFTSPLYSDMRNYNGSKDLSVDGLKLFISTYQPYATYQVVNLGIKIKNGSVIPYWDDYIEEAQACGYKLMAWNIWHKTNVSMGQQQRFFPVYHEWLFVFGNETKKLNRTVNKKVKPKKGKGVSRQREVDGTVSHIDSGDQSRTKKKMESVFKCTPAGAGVKHPATFPVELPQQYIAAMTIKGDLVVEPFCGSGSTVMACEVTERVCYAMELDPLYVDVSIERWESYTGLKAKKVR